MDSLDIDELCDAFETGRIPAAEFPHRSHVRVTWALARRYEPDDAYRRLVAGIRGIAARAGKPAVFHETITRAWFALIAGVDDLDAHPELFDKRLLGEYYSPDVLATGREQWVEPDRRALPVTATRSRRTRRPAGSVRRSAGS